jgi:hypothetical protein
LIGSLSAYREDGMMRRLFFESGKWHYQLAARKDEENRCLSTSTIDMIE